MHISELIDLLQEQEGYLAKQNLTDVEVAVIGHGRYQSVQYEIDRGVEYRKLDGVAFVCLVERDGAYAGKEFDPEFLESEEEY